MLKPLVKRLNLFCWLCLSWFAQASNELDPLKFVHLSTQQGLNHNQVHHVTQDSRGYIWLSTEAGINRFDGEKLISIDELTLQMPQRIYASTRDKSNNLWLASPQGLIGINALSGKTSLIKFPGPSHQADLSNWVIGVETHDQLVVAISRAGLYYYNPEIRDIQLVDLHPYFEKQSQIQAYSKKEKNLWLATKNKIISYDLQQKKFRNIELAPLPPDFDIQRLQVTSDNRLLIAGNKGLYIQKTPHSNQLLTISTQPVKTLTTSDTHIYFSDESFLYQVNLINLKTRLLLNIKESFLSFSADTIENIYFDNQARLWMATNTNGVFIWDSLSVQHIAIEPTTSLPLEKPLKAFSTSPDNSLWVVNQDFLLHLNSEFKELKRINLKSEGVNLREQRIFGLTSDLHKVWLYTSTGLIGFNLDANQVDLFQLPKRLNPDKPPRQSMAIQEGESIWLASQNSVIKFNSNDPSYITPKPLALMLGKSNIDYLGFNDNKLWLAADGLLFNYSEDTQIAKRIFKIPTNQNKTAIRISQVLFERNNLWIGTKSEGLFLLTKNQSTYSLEKHFHIQNGFPENNINDLVLHNNKIIAFGSHSVIQIDPTSYQINQFEFTSQLNFSNTDKGKILSLKSKLLMLHSINGISQIVLPTTAKKQFLELPLVSKITVFDQNEIKYNNSLNEFSAHLKESQWLEIQLLNPLTSTNENLYQFWIISNGVKKIKGTAGKTLILKDLPSGHSELHIQSTEGVASNSSVIDLYVVENDWLTTYKNKLVYLLILFLLGIIGYRIYKLLEKYKQQNHELHQNEERMKLALLDDRRGMWDCFINQDDYLKSVFIIHLNNHRPIKITLKKYFTMVHKEEKEDVINTWKDFAQGKSDSFYSVYRCFFYQNWIWNQVYGKVNTYDQFNRPTRAMGIWTDISQEKKIEDTLNLYSHAFQSTQDIVFILDKYLKIMAVNQAYQNTTGYPCRHLIGKNMLEIVRSRFTKDETQKIKRLVELNKRWNGESSVPRRNDSSFPVDVRVNIITKDKINKGYVVVMSDISQLKTSQIEPKRSQFYDPITGLPNKALVFDHLKELVKAGQRKKHSLSIVFLGIDLFNELAEKLTKSELESLINMFSQRILPYIKKSDFFARYEKDSFIIIFKHQEKESTSLYRVNQLLKEVARTFVIGEHRIDISACAGISRYPEDSNNWSELITQAETALAKIKTQGSNLFAYYHKDINQKALERIAIENRLSKALEAREFFLVFQPVVKLDNFKTLELDINLRWQVEEHRVAYPSQFISVIEDIGLLPDLYDWIIDTAFSCLRRWNQEGIKICLNLNLSLSYLSQQQAMDYLTNRMEFYAIEAKYLYISIREEDLAQYSDQLEAIDSQLEKIGISLVLDDFGQSEASVFNLRRMKFHSVKMDRGLVRNIDTLEMDARIFSGIVSLVNQMGMGTVAKGVENEHQLEKIKGCQCQYAQGFLFGDPMNENQTRQFLLEN